MTTVTTSSDASGRARTRAGRRPARKEIANQITHPHFFPLTRDRVAHILVGFTCRVAGIWAIQDRADQVPYHGLYQEPIKRLSRRLLPDNLVERTGQRRLWYPNHDCN